MSLTDDAMNAFEALNPALAACAAFELRFRSLFHDGRALAFDCDAQGQIDLDRLSDKARQRYLYARALVGRDFATPEILPV